MNAATRSLKTGMQNLGKSLNVDVSFYSKAGDFPKGSGGLETDPDLAQYLRNTRFWSEPLLKSRNDLEHELGVLSRISYTPTRSGVALNEPILAGMPVTKFVEHVFDRLICFVEEFSAYCLQRRLPPGITITELPLADRVVEVPERFRLTLVLGGLPTWRIAFHTSKFEET